uniref:Sesquipedalian n=1 Tax=Chelydra serpentina TaxID=8475 RepID=A0A8C3T9K4_CHESE
MRRHPGIPLPDAPALGSCRGARNVRVPGAVCRLAKCWQPRYFVLDSGILSYYDSQDDVGKGSKGSIKMAVCEIKVHPSDPTRMELVIPGEQYFYLKAGGAAERQKWLVALGSSKACLGDSRSQKDKGGSESLGRKLSELRLYCDVLTQQVLDVQESTRPQDNGSPLDIEKMNEASSLLRATCSQFISTLEECMKFANARLAPELYQPSPAPLPQDFVGTKLPHSHRVRGRCYDPSMAHAGPPQQSSDVCPRCQSALELNQLQSCPVPPDRLVPSDPLPLSGLAGETLPQPHGHRVPRQVSRLAAGEGRGAPGWRRGAG